MQLSILHKVLDQIEEQEFKLLVWGDTEGSFSEDEIIEIIERTIPDEEPDDVLDELIEKAIITRISNTVGSSVNYRSRMGHSLHLFRSLRQWMHGQNLDASKSLVSDFRFLRRARAYPIRDISVGEVISTCKDNGIMDLNILEAVKRQIGDYSLSGFQLRSTIRTLNAWEKHKRRVKYPSATITCAGTGSGKTMAFYLPALSSLAKDIIDDNSRRVRILAIYPRQELLKDQFNETWNACRKLDELTLGQSGRKIKVGALFGNTPHDSSNALKGHQQYLYSGLLQCPAKGCDGQMRWNKHDILQKKERLLCHKCGNEVLDDEVSLTRRSMENCPPDILFTTTEMLNQQMGNPLRQKLFGINSNKTIPLVLLDEVHTYGGNQGAQTAYLLRRWMKLSNSAPHFVGLSATLSDAESFFANLTGTNPSRVRLIEALPKEMEEEGAEYLLALRGDPVSQTALLSTTIQSAMLTRRVLDHRSERPSEGTWGNKTFIFTDDLDINNRLFSQLADAEGLWQRKGQLVNNDKGPLAKLRNPRGGPERLDMVSLGQDWSALKYHGFSLDDSDRASVSRTSSQDAGVDNEADLVVATASLEVGFNDPEVGAVIQHKAPRNVASYLQRKGRAGRSRTMRPWTIIVLSEFGKDRETFQHYERLLDPEIKVLGLPIENTHIHRMQAAMATLDWLGMKLKANLWLLLNQPKENKTGRLKTKLSEVLSLIEETLEPNGRLQTELSEYLQDALMLSEVQVNSALWQAPRPILLEFLPTIRRQISTCWGSWDYRQNTLVSWKEANTRWGTPVVEFIPDQLFSDLNLPSIDIGLFRGGEELFWEGMRFFQAIKEFAPGRISKRFSTYSGQSSDWLVPLSFFPNLELHNTSQRFEVEQAFGSGLNELGEFELNGDTKRIRVFRPYKIYPQSLFNSKEIAETSNAFLNWHSRFIAPQHAEEHILPTASIWSRYLKHIKFYTHRTTTPLEVVRFNTGSNCELKFKRSGKKARVNFEWSNNEEQVGIGTRLTVDAMKFAFNVTNEDLHSWLKDEKLISALRGSYLQDLIRNSNLCDGNPFMSDWVYECFLSAVTIEASQKNCPIKTAIESVVYQRSKFKLTDMPVLLFQQKSVVSEEAEDDLELKDQKLQQELIHKFNDPTLINGLTSLGRVLYTDLFDDKEFIEWAKGVLANSLAAGVHQMACVAMPQIDERSLVADPVFESNTNSLTIWLSEQDSGGSGVITQLQDLYSEDPHRLLGILARTFEPGDYERLDTDLTTLLAHSVEESDISLAFENLRNSTSHQERIAANKLLKASITRKGFQFSHSFSAVLHSRILKSGSSQESDKALLSYLSNWRDLQTDLGVELPMPIAGLMLAIKMNPCLSNQQLFEFSCKIQSVLWPRGNAVREAILSYYNPFKMGGFRTERMLAAKMCSQHIDFIEYNETDWLQSLHGILSQKGRCDLIVERDQKNEISRVVSSVHVTPLDTNGLLFYPRLKAFNFLDENVVLTWELAEAIV